MLTVEGAFREAALPWPSWHDSQSPLETSAGAAASPCESIRHFVEWGIHGRDAALPVKTVVSVGAMAEFVRVFLIS